MPVSVISLPLAALTRYGTKACARTARTAVSLSSAATIAAQAVLPGLQRACAIDAGADDGCRPSALEDGRRRGSGRATRPARRRHPSPAGECSHIHRGIERRCVQRGGWRLCSGGQARARTLAAANRPQRRRGIRQPALRQWRRRSDDQRRRKTRAATLMFYAVSIRSVPRHRSMLRVATNAQLGSRLVPCRGQRSRHR